MKICFIELPHIYLIQQKTQPPIGPLYLAAILEQNGYSVEIFRMDSLEDTIPEADLYGISSVSLDYSSAKIVAKKLKQRNSVVILGGYHATVEKSNLLNDGIWDSICVGEFESSILNVVQDFSSSKLKTIYFGKLIGDLDSIPLPARHLINDQGGSIFAYDRHYTENKLSTVISSSRGCPFNCCFCATQSMFLKKVRFRSPENVLKEIDHCINTYNIREFRFSDEVFSLNKNRTKSLVELLKKREIYWKCSTRSDCIDLETLWQMKNAGCMEIAFGLESADPDVLVALNKNETVECSEKALRMCDEVGIMTRVLMMINTPGETKKTVEKNIQFLDRVPYTCASVTVFKPLPGSSVWNNPEHYGITINNRDLDYYNIYMWVNGEIDENNSESVFTINNLSLDDQIANRKKMIEYFMCNNKMNELDKIKKYEHN